MGRGEGNEEGNGGGRAVGKMRGGGRSFLGHRNVASCQHLPEEGVLLDPG